ncbi:MAG: hypothetical protein ACRDOU_00865 [Streptosporangiaceae bacterium]
MPEAGELLPDEPDEPDPDEPQADRTSVATTIADVAASRMAGRACRRAFAG